LFELTVWDSIFKSFVHMTPNLQVIYQSYPDSTRYKEGEWFCFVNSKKYKSQILIDGTDLGDIADEVGCLFDVGLEKDTILNGLSSKTLIQDFTYTAILKEYDTIQSISKPTNYSKYDFNCACDSLCIDDEKKPHPCVSMLSYAQLPNKKYLINWPQDGNDYYANLTALNRDERQFIYDKAKAKTKAFVYFVNQELGFNKLNLADDEFQTLDRLPYMPYHREGRRIKGLTRLNIEHIKSPYSDNLYRTGIAVGDYPIDHHHKEHDFEIDKDFMAIPSFNIPMGCLIPKTGPPLLIADKAISVSHIVNGSTRLQPVIMQVGQSSGIMASIATQQNIEIDKIKVRDVQRALLDVDGYIMPTYDINPEDPHFKAIQRITACGILRLTGESYKWANRSWFYPSELLKIEDLKEHIKGYDNIDLFVNNSMTLSQFEQFFKVEVHLNKWASLKLESKDSEAPLTRRSFAVLYDFYFNPFDRHIDIMGNLLD